MNQKQQSAFFRARQAGVIREIALNNGSTGDIRKEVTSKEATRIKNRRRLAKQSRKRNR